MNTRVLQPCVPFSTYLPSMLYDFVPFLLSKILCSQYFAEVKQEIWGRKFLPPLLKFFFTQHTIIKFIYSEKATKFCEIFLLLLNVCTVVKSKGKISQNFVAFPEYINFKDLVI